MWYRRQHWAVWVALFLRIKLRRNVGVWCELRRRHVRPRRRTVLARVVRISV